MASLWLSVLNSNRTQIGLCDAVLMLCISLGYTIDIELEGGIYDC